MALNPFAGGPADPAHRLAAQAAADAHNISTPKTPEEKKPSAVPHADISWEDKKGAPLPTGQIRIGDMLYAVHYVKGGTRYDFSKPEHNAEWLRVADNIMEMVKHSFTQPNTSGAHTMYQALSRGGGRTLSITSNGLELDDTRLTYEGFHSLFHSTLTLLKTEEKKDDDTGLDSEEDLDMISFDLSADDSASTLFGLSADDDSL